MLKRYLVTKSGDTSGVMIDIATADNHKETAKIFEDMEELLANQIHAYVEGKDMTVEILDAIDKPQSWKVVDKPLKIKK